jgi:hypothetical protein
MQKIKMPRCVRNGVSVKREHYDKTNHALYFLLMNADRLGAGSTTVRITRYTTTTLFIHGNLLKNYFT